MNEDRKRILDMLAEGKIASEEAMLLLDQLSEDAPAPRAIYAPPRDGEETRMLRVRVNVMQDEYEKPTLVEINLPLKAARIAGRIVNTMMPREARETLEDQGINFADMDFDELIDALADTGGDIVNVSQQDGESEVTVRVYVE